MHSLGLVTAVSQGAGGLDIRLIRECFTQQEALWIFSWVGLPPPISYQRCLRAQRIKITPVQPPHFQMREQPFWAHGCGFPKAALRVCSEDRITTRSSCFCSQSFLHYVLALLLFKGYFLNHCFFEPNTYRNCWVTCENADLIQKVWVWPRF